MGSGARRPALRRAVGPLVARGLAAFAAAALSLALALALALTLSLPLTVSLTVSLAGFPIPGGEHDLELVQLVPLFVGSLAVGNGEKRLQARAR